MDIELRGAYERPFTSIVLVCLKRDVFEDIVVAG